MPAVTRSGKGLKRNCFINDQLYAINGKGTYVLTLEKTHNLSCFRMKHQSKSASIIVLLMLAICIPLFLVSGQAFGADKQKQAIDENLLLKKLLVTGCLAGLVVVVILVITQIRRGTEQGKAKPLGSWARRKARSPRTRVLRCTGCGRVFREELTAERTIQCPLCGHVWRWPPPLELRLLRDRMSAFALDPEKPRGDLTFATRVIARLSKSFAERVLVAGKYLESGEMLCICEKCGEIHITQKKNRGLLGICSGCKCVFLIW